MATPPHDGVIGGHFTGFLGRWNYPQPRGTRPLAAHLSRQRLAIPIRKEVLKTLCTAERAKRHDENKNPSLALASAYALEHLTASQYHASGEQNSGI